MTQHDGAETGWFLHRNFEEIAYLRGTQDEFKIAVEGEFPEHAKNVIEERGFEEVEMSGKYSSISNHKYEKHG